MAVAFAGGPALTGKQFRDLSGVSCELNEDTTSGGLRFTDVERVAGLYGVIIDYGNPLSDWPEWALENRLREGDGVILLGDAADAPVNPTSGVVYHSAFVHGYRLYNRIEQTHWHDPRNAGPTWEPIAEVLRYWAGMDHGRRFAGFVQAGQVVAPPDTGTDPGGDTNVPVKGFTITSRQQGWLRNIQAGATLIDLRDDKTYPLPAGQDQRVTALVSYPGRGAPNSLGGFLCGGDSFIVIDNGKQRWEPDPAPAVGGVTITSFQQGKLTSIKPGATYIDLRDGRRYPLTSDPTGVVCLVDYKGQGGFMIGHNPSVVIDDGFQVWTPDPS
jgi:hypothetical protein